MEHEEEIQSAGEPKTSEEGFRQRANEAARKGYEALRRGTGRVTGMAGDTARRARLRMEIHGLEKECSKIYREQGEKLWRMHRENRLGDLEAAFSEEFKRTQDLEARLEAKKKEIDAITH